MKQILLIITFLFSSILISQKATITGIVTDKDSNNQPLPFANVLVKGTTIGATTDMDGKYSITLDPGNYDIEFSFLGYVTITENITVLANESREINKSLGSESVKLQDVVVENVRKKNSETAIMMEIKEAKQVVSAISAEQISKGTDGNAAEAIQRIPGITIVEGKFVMIRGLSERYNNVLLNNSLAPSTEIDKRTFAFDLISTNTLDKMLIYKTGSADKPGDFAGGVIEISTIENSNDFTKVDIGIGYRPGTTFDDYKQTDGSNTDFLGFDNSFRPLPSNFSSVNTNVSPEIANQLPNNFGVNQRNAFLDSGITFGIGRKISLKGDQMLYTVNSLSYSNSYQYIARDFSRYTTLNPGQTSSPFIFDFNDDVFQNTVNITGVSNWIWKINNNHRFKLKNLINQQGRNETTLRDGFNVLQRPDDFFNNFFFLYQNRTLYSGQLEGEHKFGERIKLDWILGYNSLNDEMPDFRRVRTYLPSGSTDNQFIIIDPPSSNLFDTGRFYSELFEYSINNGANLTYSIPRIKGDEELGEVKLKTGYYASYRDRKFDSKYFSYRIPGNVTFERAEFLRRLPLAEAFSAQYVNNTDGWVLSEGTRASDSYTASNSLLAGYIMGEFPLKKFDITGGVRVEHNIQELNSRTDAGFINVNNPITSVLPSLNIGYNISEKSILRLAYSRTLNRPEFRELAPFLFYDYIYDVNIQGNTGLDIATIDNVDFRYEFYPSKSETISLGGFFKRFQNPIEYIIQIAESPQFIFSNADNATNYGLEFELKKSFKGLTNSLIIDRLSANINASYIVSEVDLGAQAQAQQRVRPLQGQSPYVINAAIGYKDEKDFSINLIYNRFGDRIFAVGNDNFPTIYELSRNNIDLTIAKKFNKTNVKLGIQNLTNDKFRFFEDSNLDEKITNRNGRGIDNPTSVFRRGALFTLNITYNF